MQAIYENHYLTDQDVANFARLSFSKLAANFTPEQNHSLIRFLARGMKSGDWDALIEKLLDLGKVDYAAPVGSEMEKLNRQAAHDLAVYIRKIPEHWVPFGHPHVTIRMQAPIAIARQLFKHKVGGVESEESRRYISTTPEIYVPESFRAAAVDKKQGSGGDHPESGFWLEQYQHMCKTAVTIYEAMIKDGVAPEQARFVLPQGTEVNWAWTGSLYFWSNVYNQRADSHAQKEAQILAERIDTIMSVLYPVSWAALTKGEY
jgi:thymidylate synthase (FAD)